MAGFTRSIYLTGGYCKVHIPGAVARAHLAELDRQIAAYRQTYANILPTLDHPHAGVRDSTGRSLANLIRAAAAREAEKAPHQAVIDAE